MLITRTYKNTAKVCKKGHKALAEFFGFQQQLYNAALQERESYYKATGDSISLFNQCNLFNLVRDELPDYERYGVFAARSAFAPY